MKYIGSSTRDMVANVDQDTLSPDSLQFRLARFELMANINNAGHYGCIVYHEEYKGNGVFPRHLYPINRDTLTFEERGEVKIDALYDKTKLYPTDLPHITDVTVAKICNDKWLTHKAVGNLQPKTVKLSTVQDVAMLPSLDNGSGLVAVKAFVGFGGEQVRIGTLADIQNATDLPPFPLVAQEFIETDAGVPGLVAGRHDVRVIVLNGEALGGSVRTPRKGEYLSNTHQGGTMRMLALAELPAELIDFVAQVDSALPNKPRLYAADFMYSETLGRWFLIELNASPGALPSSFPPVGPIFQKQLQKALIDIAESGV